MLNDIYDRTLEAGSGHIGDYEFKIIDGFIHFKNFESPPDHMSIWKIHLSVALHEIVRATDIFLATYQEFSGKLWKVTCPEVAVDFVDPQIAGSQAGKIFTLYDCGEDNWPQIIAAIEQRFRNAGIIPGVPVVESRPMPGSIYTYYRCDRGPKGEYLGSRGSTKN